MGRHAPAPYIVEHTFVGREAVDVHCEFRLHVSVTYLAEHSFRLQLPLLVVRTTSGDKPDELVLGYWPCGVRISSIIAVVAQDVILPSLELAWRHGVPHWLRYI